MAGFVAFNGNPVVSGLTVSSAIGRRPYASERGLLQRSKHCDVTVT